jgi:hypothetical protein
MDMRANAKLMDGELRRRKQASHPELALVGHPNPLCTLPQMPSSGVEIKPIPIKLIVMALTSEGRSHLPAVMGSRVHAVDRQTAAACRQVSGHPRVVVPAGLGLQCRHTGICFIRPSPFGVASHHWHE